MLRRSSEGRKDGRAAMIEFAFQNANEVRAVVAALSVTPCKVRNMSDAGFKQPFHSRFEIL